MRREIVRMFDIFERGCKSPATAIFGLTSARSATSATAAGSATRASGIIAYPARTAAAHTIPPSVSPFNLYRLGDSIPDTALILTLRATDTWGSRDYM